MTIGFILSPLSWWNDILVNMPLAYLFALPFGYISESLFLPAIIIGYWITNVVGFMMMHRGYHDLTTTKTSKHTRQELKKDILISIVYTIAVVAFVKMGWLAFPAEFFEIDFKEYFFKYLNIF